MRVAALLTAAVLGFAPASAQAEYATRDGLAAPVTAEALRAGRRIPGIRGLLNISYWTDVLLF